MGHRCRICGRTQPNEKFSGKGHKTHVCKDCRHLPVEERRRIKETAEIFGFLTQSHISSKNLVRLDVLTASSDEKVAWMAGVVLKIGKVRPYKRSRIRFLARERRDLFVELCKTGCGPCELYDDYDPYYLDMPVEACWNCGTLYCPAETGRCGECGLEFQGHT